jgi:hypothetical protein
MSMTNAVCLIVVLTTVLRGFQLLGRATVAPSSGQGHLSITFTIDGPVYVATLRTLPPGNVPVLNARLLARSSGRDITLDFRSTQRCDLRVRSADGKETAMWSAGRVFGQSTGRETIGVQEREVCKIGMPLGKLQAPGQGPWAAGDYTAEIWIEGHNSYMASIPFTLRHH